MSAAAADAVAREAMSWLGTPYHHHGRVKGAGVDCAQILAAVYEEAGLVPHLDLGQYAPQWHLHRSEELYLGWLAKVGARRVEAPIKGDVGVWRFGRTFSHGGIFVEDDLVVHSYIGKGVILTRLREEPLVGRDAQFWRLV